MCKLRIAIQGCCHGQLASVFKKVKDINSRNKIDLLIILGDFQSIRNNDDLSSISIPYKYQQLGDFHKYYNSDDVSKVPVPVIFIGGNHESMRHLMELPYGGYAAPNIYYLGYSNVVWFKGIRIGSLSGIYKDWDFNKSRPSWQCMETQHWNNFKGYPKYNIKSLYHVRYDDVLPLYLMNQKKPIDIMLSHDWPSEVVYYGDIQKLLERKPFFKRDINNHDLGSPINWELLCRFEPKWWLSAHLHVKYRAIIPHTSPTNNNYSTLEKNNKDEIELDLSDDDNDENVIAKEKETPLESLNCVTHFLSLDKCLPGRQWLEIVEVEADENHESYKNWVDDNMLHLYWDDEYIRVLGAIRKGGNIKKMPISKVNAELLSVPDTFSINTPNPHGEKEIKHNNYKIPDYVKGIQRKEQEQTTYFEKAFLNQ